MYVLKVEHPELVGAKTNETNYFGAIPTQLQNIPRIEVTYAASY